MTDYISDTTDPSDGTFTYCSGSGWVAYKDEKCFKLIKKLSTRAEADKFAIKNVYELIYSFRN